MPARRVICSLVEAKMASASALFPSVTFRSPVAAGARHPKPVLRDFRKPQRPDRRLLLGVGERAPQHGLQVFARHRDRPDPELTFWKLLPTTAASLSIRFGLGMHQISYGVAAHSDVKPQNLMMDFGAFLKLADFGLALTVGATLSPMARRGRCLICSGSSQPTDTARAERPGTWRPNYSWAAIRQFRCAGLHSSGRKSLWCLSLRLPRKAKGLGGP